MMDEFAATQTSLQNSLVATTRSVSRLAAEDLAFYRSLEPALGTQLDAQNARLLGLAQRLLGSATTSTEVVRPSLKDIDDVEGNWTKVVDVIDSLLERADTALDEFTGAVKRLTPREGTPSRALPNSQKLAASFRNQDIEKPQLLFEDAPDNFASGPFRPLLSQKPYALRPLQLEPSPLADTGTIGFDHPYVKEIGEYKYPEDLHTYKEPVMYNSFEETQATLVETEEALDAMIAELKEATEIAVDLEHHDTRSYIGIVSLMQISTRNHDWIIDTLKPWRRKLNKLNEVFANPAILKVLHGAYMDIMWLQRDFGLYVVGLFDTYHAARALGYPGASYAYLLKRFTDVDAQKQFQMADWRIRPLPTELIDYARSDTHYLLYVFDNMRNELIERSDASNEDMNKIRDVLDASKETSLQRYEYPVYDFETGMGAAGWFKVLSKTPASFNKEQFAVFRAVHQWRDKIAREQDDSVFYVMPPYLVFTVARAMPMSKAELLKVAQPLTQTLRLRADELVAVIVAAKESSADAPDMIDVLSKSDSVAASKVKAHVVSERAQQIEGVAKYINKANSINGHLPQQSVLTAPLRALKSLFWGPAITPVTQQKRSHSTLQMSVPLPPLTSEVFTENVVETEPAAEPVVTPVQPAREEAEDDVFILRQLNGKRKLASDNDDGMALQADQIALPDEQAERARLKADRKRARKEAKRAVKAGQTSLTGSTSEQPFDYAAAPSILSQSAPDKKAKKQKKSFDPYSKSMNAPKGLPRVQKESAGRSMTYAS